MTEVKKKESNVPTAKMPMPTSSPERFDLFPQSRFIQEMDRLFDEYMPHRWWHQLRFGWPGQGMEHLKPFEGKSPSVDVIDRDGDLLVKAELPGVDKKDISLTIADNVLTLEAKIEKEEKEEKEQYYRREISRGAFKRVIQLPTAVKEEEAKASFKNGILELILPKVEKTKRATIEVK
ncbi:MAG: Hsp20/alpha crystallin family protein [Desulfobulbus sp.]|nr:Hsp20/alpha crystallin family protein [Desulfobulbus sp.]